MTEYREVNPGTNKGTKKGKVTHKNPLKSDKNSRCFRALATRRGRRLNIITNFNIYVVIGGETLSESYGLGKRKLRGRGLCKRSIYGSGGERGLGARLGGEPKVWGSWENSNLTPTDRQTISEPYPGGNQTVILWRNAKKEKSNIWGEEGTLGGFFGWARWRVLKLESVLYGKGQKLLPCSVGGKSGNTEVVGVSVNFRPIG